MGTLAGCLKRLNLTGETADLIRDRVQGYKDEGYVGTEAAIQAVKGLLAETRTARRDIIQQLSPTLKSQLRKGGDDEAGTPEKTTGAGPALAPRGRRARLRDEGAKLARTRQTPGQGSSDIRTHAGVVEAFKKVGHVDYVGRSVPGPDALAEMASEGFRNRDKETLRMVFLDQDRRLLQTMPWTSRNPSMVAPFFDAAGLDRFIGEIKATKLRKRATFVFAVHNHPSGNPRPSQPDINLTDTLAERIEGFEGHVVIDHGRYAWIPANRTDAETAFTYHPIQNANLRANSQQNPLNNRDLSRGPDAVADLGRAVLQQKGYLAVVFASKDPTSNFPMSVAAQEIAEGNVLGRDYSTGQEREPFAGYIRNATRDFGGREAYVYLHEPSPRVEMRLLGLLMDGVLRDVVVNRGDWNQSFAEELTQVPVNRSIQGRTVKDVFHQTRRLEEPEATYGRQPPGTAPPERPPNPPPQDAFLPESIWSTESPSQMDNFRRIFQDQWIDTRKTVEAVDQAIRTLGGQLNRLPDILNPVLYADTYSSKQDDQVLQFEKQEFNPLYEELERTGKTVEELNDYLMAMTAHEANAYFQSINPPDQQGDLFGEWDNTALSGMSNADADAILAAADHAVMRPLADQAFAILKKTRELMVQYGEESQETIDQWERENPLYIPRRREGFEDEEHELGRPAGLAVAGRTVKTALGSQRKVVDVMGHIVSHRMKVIARGERMRPILALAAMLTKYPNTKFAKLTRPLTFQYINPATGLTETLTQPHGTTGQSRRIYDTATKTVKWVRQSQGFYADNVVPFKVKGRQYGLVFELKDARAKQMARALKGKDVKVLGGSVDALTKPWQYFYNLAFDKAAAKEMRDTGVNIWTAGLGTLAGFTRYVAAINTQYSPVFGPWNFMRDTFFAAATLANTVLDGQQWGIFREGIANIKDLYLELRAERAGVVRNPDMARRLARFRGAGGPTGWRNLYLTGEEQAQQIVDMLHPSRFQKAWRAYGGKAVGNWVQDYNAAFENAIRLAVFERALAMGLSEVKAASMDKDATVNFNRRGTASTQLGALYAFFNVTMQSSERVITTMFEKGQYGQLTAAGKKILYGGALLGSMQAATLAMMGFKDDEPPEFIKQRSFIIPAPFTDKGYLAIPMPLGFNAFPNLGRLLTEAMIYGDPQDKVVKLVDSLWGVADPLGGSSSFFQEIAPTALDPAVQLLENKDWTGRSIYREDFLASKPTTGASRANYNAGQWALYLSRATNFLLGGTEYAPGFIGETSVSPPPEVFEHLLSFLGGGPGRELTKVGRIYKGVSQDQQVELYNIPLIGRLIGEATGSAQQWERWRKNMATLHRHGLEMKGRQGRADEMAAYRNKHPLAKLVSYGTHVESRLRKLLSRRRKLAMQEDTPLSRKERTRLDTRMKEMIGLFNARIENAQQS